MEWFEKILESQQVSPNILKSFTDISESADYKWAQDISEKGSYKLVDMNENKVIGTINIREGLKKFAQCEILNKKFTITKKGLFNPRIVIYENLNNVPISTFYYSTWKGDGVLALADGTNYFWELYERLNNEWMFYDKFENEVLHFKPRTSFFKSGYYIHTKGKQIDQNAKISLMILGIFNLMISHEDVSVDALVM